MAGITLTAINRFVALWRISFTWPKAPRPSSLRSSSSCLVHLIVCIDAMMVQATHDMCRKPCRPM